MDLDDKAQNIVRLVDDNTLAKTDAKNQIRVLYWMQYLLFSNGAKSVRYLKRSVVKSENSKIVSNIFFQL